MRHGSLFSGIDGFSLAADWMNWQNIFQVEIDNYCQKLLNKNFPNVTKYKDIKEFDGTQYRGTVDILTGGFPCQGFSVAGKQRGKSDTRYLWPQMLRVVREIQSPWIVGENVPGIIKLALEDICLALEGENYAVQPFIIPSASIGAWDKRERVWIIAHLNKCTNNKNTGRIFESEKNKELETQRNEVHKCCISPKFNPDIESTISEQSGKTRTGRNRCTNGNIKNSDINKFNSNNAGHNSGAISQQQATKVQFNNNTISQGLQGHSRNDLSGREKEQERQAGQANWLRDWIEVASELCRSDARVSHRMERIKALGNSVNPYIVYELFKAIEQFCSE